MTVPTSYTMVEFADYLHKEVIPQQAAFHGYSTDPDGGSYVEPTNDALLQMRLTAPEAVVASSIREFRLRGKIAALKKALRDFGTAYDVGGLTQTLSRSQLFRQTKALLDEAELELKNMLIQDREDAGLPPRGTPMSGVRPTRSVWALSVGRYDERYDDAAD